MALLFLCFPCLRAINSTFASGLSVGGCLGIVLMSHYSGKIPRLSFVPWLIENTRLDGGALLPYKKKKISFETVNEL